MARNGPTAFVRREQRRIVERFRPLVEAARGQQHPSPELRAALARIETDPMLEHFLSRVGG